jgi:3',5'-nucleoside bisphosphate phosphatase
MKSLADLHIHTRYSDGSLSPDDIVRIAGEKGLCCISITDHDSVFAIDQAICAGNDYNIEVIPGVEISAEEDGREMHILGYCIDHKDKELLDFLDKIRQDRIKRLYEIAERLNRHQVEIDVQELMDFTGDVSISRLHIAKFMQVKGLVANWREAFSRYIGDLKPCYVASFRYKSKEVIDTIKQSGGIAVIAHPGLSRLDNILTRLIQEGLGGIEAFHYEHSDKKAKQYQDFAEKYNLVVTGGSDCHGDLKGELLIGKSAIDYSYVEDLKNAAQRH